MTAGARSADWPPATASPRPPALRTVRLKDFRCFAEAELPLHPRLTTIVGGNGSGKTSLLESIFVLVHGRSFRSPDPRALIRSGAGAADLSGAFDDGLGERQLGAHVEAGQVALQLDRVPNPRRAELARLVPLQVLDADLHDLIQGGPERRRRLLDWGLFHVEHPYLGHWQRFRRALAQRNASLRAGGDPAELEAWDQEFVTASLAVDELRRVYVQRLLPRFAELAGTALGVEVEGQYRPGWPAGEALDQVLRAARAADLAQAQTRAGPHRADIAVTVRSRTARWHASRGQLKLLGAAVVLSQARLVAEVTRRPVVLLVDEPAADLDAAHLARYADLLRGCPAQLIVAGIEAHPAFFASEGHLFHVEHGAVKALL